MEIKQKTQEISGKDGGQDKSDPPYQYEADIYRLLIRQ